MYNETEIIIENEKETVGKDIEKDSFCGGFCSAFSYNNMVSFYCPLMLKKDIYEPTNIYCKYIGITTKEFIKLINEKNF